MDKSLNYISSMCTNKSQPHLKDLKRIAKILDVDIRELLISTKPLDNDNFNQNVHQNRYKKA